jgi:hypothetical protein
MFGRVSYYFKKLRSAIKQKGFISAGVELISFLIRRQFFLQFGLESFEYHVLARIRSLESTLLAIHKNEPIESKRVLIYASFDKNSRILPHVLQQLEAFKEQGYQTIFVSTSPFFGLEQAKPLYSLSRVIFHRKNQGYDFCSWALAYEMIKDQRREIESLIIMNDSCLGPYFDLTASLEKMRLAPNSVYGITKSYEITEYLQSYFFHFGKDLNTSGIVDQFFSRIRVLNSKWCIVRYLEIGSSRFLRSKGVLLQALADPKERNIAELMLVSGQTEPSADPVGKNLVEIGINPFHKRSNLKQ